VETYQNHTKAVYVVTIVDSILPADFVSVNMEIDANTSTSLKDEQWKYFLRNDIPVFVYLIMIISIGVIGNLHTIGIQLLRFKPSNHRILIVWLATTDLMFCCIGTPYLMVTVRHSYTFTSKEACKFFNFLNFSLSCYSLLLVDLIAIDRYRKICRPTSQQLKVSSTKLACLILLMFAFVCVGVPSTITYGLTSVQTITPNLVGLRCTVDETLKSSLLSKIFHGSILIMIVSGCILCLVLYALISNMLNKRQKLKDKVRRANLNQKNIHCTYTEDNSLTSNVNDISMNCSFSSREESCENLDEKSVKASRICIGKCEKEHAKSESLGQDCDSNDRVTAKSSKSSIKTTNFKQQLKNNNRSVQITRMFMVASAVSYLSYLPFLAVVIFRGVDKTAYESYERKQKNIYI